jgi:hypothetical protein
MWREFPDHPAVNLQKRCEISRFWSGFLRQPKHDSQHSRRIPTFRLKNRRTFAPFTSYFIEPEPAETAKSAHEHLFRVVVGNKQVVRFCERCGRTWLTTELRDILHTNRFVYTWSEVLEEAEANEKLNSPEEQPRQPGLKRYINE